MKISQLTRILYKFYIKHGKLDISNYGVYRLGLTSEEIICYLQARANKINIKRLYKKFNRIAGCNTCAVAPNGEHLMYRWDVERFADALFNGTATYFD